MNHSRLSQRLRQTLTQTSSCVALCSSAKLLSSTFEPTFEVKRELKRGSSLLYASWGYFVLLLCCQFLCPIETIIYGWKALNVSFLTHLESPQLDIYNSSYSCLKCAPLHSFWRQRLTSRLRQTLAQTLLCPGAPTLFFLEPTFDLTFEANVGSNVAASRDAISLLFGANV